ncbi:CPBP family intramembrane glutamic endopeptidase [Dyadobacter sp. CY312]|uniref:CPBP family intramembrane glutamic endopeptidase n=1 Tax=Dyadobacter sp. CY312 TaxID=2907303 RepID=UPI001F2A1116|nr:type II CAAX endopeptidase family protein [Dyadobacter sp. CY312]MCE7038845.1 CPBP family intramembrane metalloprotease [Dyadobacter sp. CY312]
MEKQIYSNRGWQRVLLILIPYFLIVGGFNGLGLYVAGMDFTKNLDTKTSEQTLIVMSFTLLGTLVLLAIFLKYVDKKKFSDLGLNWLHAGKDIFTGVWLGLVIMLIGLTVLLFTGQLQITDFSYSTYEILIAILLFIFVSVNEEIFIRGYVLQNLMVSFNKYIALVVSSLLFSLMHIFNSDLDLAGIISLFLAGLLLGLCYLRTGSLWLPIALHFSWNFFQCLFGFNVSGQDQYSLITTTYNEANIWNGGKFGFEGSLLGSLFQIPTIVYVYLKYRNRPVNVSPTEVAVTNVE